MSQFIQMNMGAETILVEATGKVEESEKYQTYDENAPRGDKGNVIVKIDQALDSVIQNQIVEHCKMLTLDLPSKKIASPTS